MPISRKSLSFHLVFPVFFTVIIILAALVFSVSWITKDIIEGFWGHSLTGHIRETRLIIDIAQADLTTARLLDNPSVVEAKKKLVLEAILLKWQRNDVMGMIVGKDGSVLASPLPPEITAGLLSSRLNNAGQFQIDVEKSHLFGQMFSYPAWEWRLYVATRTPMHDIARRGVFYLIPLAIFSSLLIITALFILLHRKLQKPISVMVEDVRMGRDVRQVGVNEFDMLGGVINDALASIAESNRELSHELQERKKAEESLRLFKGLVNQSNDSIFIVNPETGIFLDVNNHTCSSLGYTREEMLTMGPQDIAEAIPDKFSWEAHVNEIKKRRHMVFEDRQKKKDGTSLLVEVSVKYIEDEKGNYLGAIARDITERKKAEEKINFFASIIKSLPDAVCSIDLEGNINTWNEGATRMLGYTTEEVLGKPITMLIPPELAQAELDHCMNILNTEGYFTGYESVRIAKSGKRIPVEMTAVTIRGAEEKYSVYASIMRDVSARKKLEEQLRTSQKMEAIGQLAGGVAHDFNNILTAIIGYGEMALIKIPHDDPLRPNIQYILEGADKAVHLIQSLLAFSRKQVIDRKPTELNGIIKKIEKLLVRIIGEHIAFKTIIREETLHVIADAGQLEQVLMNLATNARDAMSEGGAFTISSKKAKLDEEFIHLHGFGKPGTYAIITASDTGTGMDEETKEKIFDPFFTTKEVGKGTGLGLAVVYGIIKQHDGYINVYSEPGKGTTFRIYLPLIASPVAKEEIAAETQFLQGGTETILLAEDDETLRNLAKTILYESGYKVIEAIDGEDAIKKFMDNKNEIQLFLSDLVMPRRSGKKAYDQIRKIRTDVKAIFMTGHSPDIIQEKIFFEKEAVLFKPISPAALLKAVREVLDR